MKILDLDPNLDLKGRKDTLAYINLPKEANELLTTKFDNEAVTAAIKMLTHTTDTVIRLDNEFLIKRRIVKGTVFDLSTVTEINREYLRPAMLTRRMDRLTNYDYSTMMVLVRNGKQRKGLGNNSALGIVSDLVDSILKTESRTIDEYVIAKLKPLCYRGSNYLLVVAVVQLANGDTLEVYTAVKLFNVSKEFVTLTTEVA